MKRALIGSRDPHRVESSWISRNYRNLNQCSPSRLARDVLEQHRLCRWQCRIRRVRSAIVSLLLVSYPDEYVCTDLILLMFFAESKIFDPSLPLSIPFESQSHPRTLLYLPTLLLSLIPLVRYRPTTSILSSLSTALSEPFISHPPSYSHPPIRDAFVSRQEYLESGSNACRRKFARFYWDSKRGLEAELGSG